MVNGTINGYQYSYHSLVPGPWSLVPGAWCLVPGP
jgi:hypothetical protein